MGGSFLVTHAVLRTANEPARFGYIISKKVGNAVIRNRIRRRLKGISDSLLQSGVTGMDVVIRALPAAAGATFAQLNDEVQRQIRKIESLRASHVDGV